MANFFHSVGYPAENVHSGMIAYICDLWNEGRREPLDSFLGHLRVSLETRNSLRVNREWKRIDLVVFDTECDFPVVAIEMKVDSHEGLVKGVPQTIAYQERLSEWEGTPFLFVTLGVGEFYHAPQGGPERVKWIRLRDFHGAVEAISSDDLFIEKWRETIRNEVDLQDRCFSGDPSRIEEYRGKTWSLYFLAHLKENLLDSLGDRNIGIDPFVYSYGPSPDTILYFGRAKLPAYLEINNNALLNLKVNLEDLVAKEDKQERIQKAQDYYQDLLRGHDPQSNSRKLDPRWKSFTVMSFNIGLVRRDGNLFYPSIETEKDTVERLYTILETFYGSPRFAEINMDPSTHPPHFK